MGKAKKERFTAYGTRMRFMIVNEIMNLKKLAEQLETSVAMLDKHYGYVAVQSLPDYLSTLAHKAQEAS